MTDRLAGFTVTFKEPMRDDDAEAVLNAVRLLYNVANVSPTIQTGEAFMIEQRINEKWREKLRALMFPES